MYHCCPDTVVAVNLAATALARCRPRLTLRSFRWGCGKCNVLCAPTGIRANEAKAINLSLTVLGMCINARASANASHAPYRDSKLTRILKVRATYIPLQQTVL